MGLFDVNPAHAPETPTTIRGADLLRARRMARLLELEVPERVLLNERTQLVVAVDGAGRERLTRTPGGAWLPGRAARPTTTGVWLRVIDLT